jgi:undecaprenyl-diphosphatase
MINNELETVNEKEVNLSFIKKIFLSVLLFIVCITIFSMLANKILIQRTISFDEKIFTYFKNHQTQNLVSFFTFISYFGSLYFLPFAYLFLVFYLFQLGNKAVAIDTLILGITSTLLLFAIKAIVGRQRPTMPILRELNSYSFPSGHSLLSFVFFSILVKLIWHSTISKTAKVFFALFFLIFSLLIGISRIILRYHYPSDVLAGFCLGFAYVLLFYGIAWFLKNKKAKV